MKLYPFRKYSDTLLGNSEEGEGKGQKPKFLKKSKKSNIIGISREQEDLNQKPSVEGKVCI